MKTIDNIKNINAITDTIINPVFADSYDKPPIISLLEKFFVFHHKYFLPNVFVSCYFLISSPLI